LCGFRFFLCGKDSIPILSGLNLDFNDFFALNFKSFDKTCEIKIFKYK